MGLSSSRTVFDFAAQAGALLLRNGAATADAVQAMLDITGAADIADVSVDATYSEVILSHRPPGEIPYIQIQTVHGRNFNYGKLTDVSTLVERFTRGEIAVADALTTLHTIETSRGPYPWWLTRLAAGFAGGSAALIFGGGWLVMLAAFAANLALDYLLGVLGRRRWPSFFMQAVAGVVAVLVAILIRVINPAIDPPRVVVSVIIVMFAGMTSTAAVRDAITGWYLTALGRIFEAVMNTIGLIVGVAFGVLVADRLGVTLAISANVAMGALQLPLMLLAAGFVALGFSFVAQNPARIILPTALLSAAAYAAFSGAEAARFGVIWSSAAAAFVAGAVAVLYAQWLRAPAEAFAICAILALVPGLNLYQGLVAISHASPDATPFLATAVGTALALAGGLTFGEYFALVAWRQVRLVENRFFAPLFAAPVTTVSRRPAASEDDADAGGTADRSRA